MIVPAREIDIARLQERIAKLEAANEQMNASSTAATRRALVAEAEVGRLTESVLHERRQVVLAKQHCRTTEQCACLWRDGLKAGIAAEAKLRTVEGLPEKIRKVANKGGTTAWAGGMLDAAQRFEEELEAALNPPTG